MTPPEPTVPGANQTGSTDLSAAAPTSGTPASVAVGRLMMIGFAVALGVSLVGFLAGIREPVVPRRAAPHGVVQAGPRTTAPAYRELSSRLVGPNRDWASNVARLVQTRPGLFDPVTRTPAMKQAALQDRLRTRAFDGAPPSIPHAVEQQSATACLVCHKEGLQLGGRIATKISHPHFGSCMQCHVESAARLPWLANGPALTDSKGTIVEVSAVGNEFSGLLRSGPGQRAMPGAPPAIPHTTQLRGDCLSCHGLVTRPGLRTTHPWLQNCVQCHAPSAELDQIPFAAVGEPDAAGTASLARKALQ